MKENFTAEKRGAAFKRCASFLCGKKSSISTPKPQQKMAVI
jgi:hypothetical protein